MNLTTVLVIVLVLILLGGAFPAYGHHPHLGYGVGGLGGLLLIVLLIVLLRGG